ncbi:MAG: hypothetical protein LBC40_05695 [Dysgonamonadaceae bacterium]|jgi:hypothetical protein|nr:hypothetical protein [Dysgonamonadaceae bacterium]
MALIRDIKTLKETVKAGASAPWESLQPFVSDAERFYLHHYLGESLIERLNTCLDDAPQSRDPNTGKLLKCVQAVLGPLSYMLATYEAGIGFGDAGHTVVRTQTVAPASDTKVERARESAMFRGWQNLEIMLEYLDAHSSLFPEWEQSRYRMLPRPKFFRSATDFQYHGMIDINHSRLTYEKLSELIRRVECSEIREMITGEVYSSLANPFSPELSHPEKELVACIQPYIAARVAMLHTGTVTREQRAEPGRPEYRPVIRPLFEDLSETGNYYASQQAFWKSKITEALRAFNIDNPEKLNWNSREKKLFADIG